MPDAHDDVFGTPAGFRDLAGIVLGESSFDAVLQRMCEVVKASVSGAHEVSITLIDNGAPRTVAFSGEIAVRVDESQYAAGYGPCLDAARTGKTITVDDLHDEAERWPDYVPPALAAGVLSSVSLPLSVNDRLIGAVNVYSTESHTFDPATVQSATALAQYGGVLLSNANLYYQATSMAEQMQQAMSSRAVIEQAKGVLMAQSHCTADEAFEKLVRISQESHRKLRDVAISIIEGLGR